MNKEINKRKCKVCNELKERIQDGYFENSTTCKRYINEAGKLWNGSTCPECHKNKIAQGMRKLRAK